MLASWLLRWLFLVFVIWLKKVGEINRWWKITREIGGRQENRGRGFRKQACFEHSLFDIFYLKFIYFASWLQFLFPPFLPFPHPQQPSLSSIHSSSISVQKRTGLPWTSTKYGISICRKTKHLPCIKAGQGNSVHMVPKDSKRVKS